MKFAIQQQVTYTRVHEVEADDEAQAFEKYFEDLQDGKVQQDEIGDAQNPAITQIDGRVTYKSYRPLKGRK